MQSPVADNCYCPSCNHMIVVLHVAGIFGEYHEPMKIANCFLHHQHPINNCAMAKDEANTMQGDISVNELRSDRFSEGISYEETGTTQGDTSMNELKSDQWSLFSEGISYEETGSDHNGDSYNSLDDQQQTTTCEQCCTLGSDEMVIPKLHNWPLSTDNSHTTVC